MSSSSTNEKLAFSAINSGIQVNATVTTAYDSETHIWTVSGLGFSYTGAADSGKAVALLGFIGKVLGFTLVLD